MKEGRKEGFNKDLWPKWLNKKKKEELFLSISPATVPPQDHIHPVITAQDDGLPWQVPSSHSLFEMHRGVSAGMEGSRRRPAVPPLAA